MHHFLPLAAGLLGFGFPILIFRAWDVATGRATLFFVLVGVFFFGAVGAALCHLTGPKSRVSLYAAFLLSTLTFHFSWPGDWSARSIPMLAAWALALVAGGFAQASLLTESPRRLKTLSLITLGSLIGNGFVLSLDYFSYPDTVRLLLVTTAVLITLNSPRVLLPAMVIALWPIPTPDPIPEYTDGKIYSSALTQLKVAKLNPGIMRGKHLQSDGESFVLPGLENLNLYTVIRNAKEATLIYDAEEEKDLELLKQNLTYRLMGVVKEKNRVAIVGSGAGHEVQVALLLGFREVVAIEINPLMIQVASDYSRRPELSYRSPRVRVAVDDAHHWFRRLPEGEKFDLIFMSNVRFYGTSGGSLFNENYVNTRESYRAMAEHLAPDGILMIRHHGMGKLFHEVLTSTLHSATADRPEAGEIFVGKLPRGDENLMGNNYGVVAAYRRGAYSPRELSHLREAMWNGFRQRHFDVHARAPAGTAVATIDRPFPDWLAHGMQSRHFVPAAALTLVTLFGFALALNFVSNSAPMIYAFLSGAGFLGIELVYLWSADLVSGLPSRASICVVAVLLLSGALGTIAAALTERENLWSPSLAVLAIYSAASWFFISRIEVFPADGASALLILCLILLIPGFLAGFAYANFFGGTKASPALILASNGIGGLAAGAGLKFLSLELGYFSVHFLTVGIFIAMLALSRRLA